MATQNIDRETIRGVAEVIEVVVYQGKKEKVFSSMLKAEEFCKENNDTWLIDYAKYEKDITK